MKQSYELIAIPLESADAFDVDRDCEIVHAQIADDILYLLLKVRNH